MINNKFVNFALIIIISISLLFSISSFIRNYYSEKDAKKYLPGTYLYTFPSGEASILKVNSDLTFNNKAYSKDKKQVLYETNGTIELDGRTITCDKFLLFSDHNESEMIFSKPDIGISSAYWEKSKDDKEGLTIEYSVYNYIFKKIE